MKRKQKNQVKLQDITAFIEATPSFGYVEAKEEGGERLRTFEMLAYTGQPIQQFWSAHSIVIDVAGMSKVKKSIPVLRDHDQTRIVGHSTVAKTENGKIELAGIVSGVGDDAVEVAETSKNGFPWQASIGASIQRMVFLKPGKTALVNGKEHIGPMYIARKSRLNEVSFVTNGADNKTSANVAASAASFNQEVFSMEFEKWLEALGLDPNALEAKQLEPLQAKYDAEVKAKAAAKVTPDPEPKKKIEATDDVDPVAKMREEMAIEAKRVSDVSKHLKDFPELQAEAIKDGWTSTEAELKALRKNTPTAPAIHAGGSPEFTTSTIECGLRMSIDTGAAVKEYGEELCDKTIKAGLAGSNKQLGLGEAILIVARQNGYNGRNARDVKSLLDFAFRKNSIEATGGFSNINIPGILSNVANKSMKAGFDAVEQAWREISTTSPVRDFKQTTAYRMIADAMFAKVGPGGELEHGDISEESFTNQAETYGRMYAITRTDIINDDLNALGRIPRRLGFAAGRKLNDVFWTEFMDNSSFFTAGNNNVSTGALSSAGLQAAVLVFRDQTDPSGFPLALEPSILLVPNNLEVTADELFVSTNINTGGSSSTDKVPNTNIFNAKYRPVVSAYLNNTLITGNSTTAYYLLANPNQLETIEVVFLNGVQNPTIESADADFNTLGIQMRGFFDFGVNKQEFRAGVRSTGA